jgi:YidC/Oxa1 family membrane protein insertase
MLNFLVWIYTLTGNFGVAVIALTLLIKVLTNPLNEKALQAQKTMAEIQPRLKEIQTKYKNDNEKQAQAMIDLYKETKFNPFSSIFLIFVQIPVLWALFYIFKAGIVIDASMLYSFISLPSVIDPYFFGIDLGKPNLYLAIIAAIAQYFQAKTSMPTIKDDGKEKDKTVQMSEMMQKQMVFIVPFITLFILANLPSALGLYWIITTIFTVIQQRSIFNKKKEND